MIYFRNKKQCFECDGLEDWHHSSIRGQWSLKTSNVRPQGVQLLEDRKHFRPLGDVFPEDMAT